MLMLLSLIVVLLLGAASTLARAVGARQAASPALDGFDIDCAGERYCWHGVVQRRTSVEEGWALLAGIYQLPSSALSPLDSDPDSPQCSVVFFYEHVTINRISVKCRDLRLGDWLLRFGSPGGVSLDQHWLYYLESGRRMRVRFSGALRPYTPIDEFSFPLPFAFHDPMFAWSGFAPRWRYCRNTPEACP
jgi:hypothetical protein